MAKTFAFECGECCNGILMIDGYRETVFDEDDWDSFLSLPPISVLPKRRFR